MASITGPLDYTTGDPVSPSIGDEVKFTFEVDDAYPTIEVRCYQGDTLVYAETHGMWPDSYNHDKAWQLGPTSVWPSGDAEGVAVLKVHQHGTKLRDVAETTFIVRG